MIHDMTWSAWGHAVHRLDPPDGAGHRALAMHTTPTPKEGDVVLLASATAHPATGRAGILQYRVVGDVRTPMDPGDLHFLTVAFMADETNAADGRDPRTTDIGSPT